ATVFLNVVQVLTWVGGGDGSSWSDERNWDVDMVPDHYAIVVVPAGANGHIAAGEARDPYSLAVHGRLTNAGFLGVYADSYVAQLTSTGTVAVLAGATLIVDGSDELSGSAHIEDGAELRLAHGSFTLGALDVLTGVTGEHTGYLCLQGAAADVIGTV